MEKICVSCEKSLKKLARKNYYWSDEQWYCKPCYQKVKYPRSSTQRVSEESVVEENIGQSAIGNSSVTLNINRTVISSKCIFGCQSDRVLRCFKNFALMVQAKFNSKIATLRCDNGREYVSHEFQDFCKENGTQLNYTIPYTPAQNGKAERFNRSLVDKARAMTHEAIMPKTFWNEAVRVAAYILNRSPSAGNSGDEVPARIWYDKKPNISNMRVYGSMAYAHVPKEMRKMFDFKAEECIMIGYSTTGYRLWNIERKKIIVARDVIFKENKFYYKNNIARIGSRNEYETN